MKFSRSLAGIAWCALLVIWDGTAGAAAPLPRLIVLTDMGQDPDDQQSLIRLLLYANEFDIEGIIATADNNSAQEAAVIRTDLIHAAIDRYGAVLPRLREHAAGYPEAAALQAVVKPGNHRGGTQVAVFDTIGPGRETEGAQWIIRQADREDPRPLNIAVWGGACDLAQALWTIQSTRSPGETAAFVRRLRVHAIGEQDSTNAWIREQFPQLFLIRDLHPGGDRFQSAYRGMYLGGDVSTLTRDWLNTFVKEHGPLGDFYPDRAATGRNHPGCIKEGDTPSWFYFLQNGLQDPEQPGFGGWGGRFRKAHSYFEDAQDTVGNETSYRATVWRWRSDFQNDFAARMNWCRKDFKHANHHPLAILQGNSSRDILYHDVPAGDVLHVSAEGSHDPDGDALRFEWWIYPEAGTYAKPVRVASADQPTVEVLIPPDAKGRTIHLILSLHDTGAPPLTTYRRLVVRPQ